MKSFGVTTKLLCIVSFLQLWLEVFSFAFCARLQIGSSNFNFKKLSLLFFSKGSKVVCDAE